MSQPAGDDDGGRQVRVLLSVGAAALLVLRMSFGAHAPSVVDAHAALAALALAFVAAAPRPALLAAAFVVTGALVSIPTSWDPWISLLALPAVLGPAALFVLASTGSCRAGLLTGVTLGGVLNAGFAYLDKLWRWPDALTRIEELGLDAAAVARLSEARPLGLSVSPDLAGGLCLAGAFCAGALAVEVKVRRARVALVSAALLSASGLLVVRSFGCALALALGVLVSAVLFAWRRSPRQALWVGGGGIVVASAALAATVISRGASALARSAGERAENWRAAWSIFVEQPLLGVGFMRFPAAYVAERGPEANLTRYAHSAPFQIFAETGAVGAVLVAGALAVLARAIVRRRARLDGAQLVLAGAAAAYAFRFTMDYDAHVAQTASVAAVVLGLLLAAPAPSVRPAGSAQRRAVAAVAAFVLVLVVILAAREGVLEAEDDGALERYSAVLPFDREPRIARAALAVDGLAAACMEPEACERARRVVFEALAPVCDSAHPTPAAFVLRAKARLTHADLAGALADVDRALAVDPGNAAAHTLGIAIAGARGEDAGERLQRGARWRVATPP